MEKLAEFTTTLSNQAQIERIEAISAWIHRKFPQLKLEIKWKQPMWLDHGTFIIAFSVSKNHISVSPEQKGIALFKDDLINSGYVTSKMLFQIQNEQDVPYELLSKMIEYNMIDKANCHTFWRDE